ncbi:DUF1983 domain-containing protein [Salmonella enterica]|nr:DUF1983 domain-containing protein [Salmonella enterica]
MDQIANLVIDLSIDSAEFRNEVPRIKKLLNDAAGDSERSAARMQRFLDKQTEATRRTSASLEQVTASSTAYSSSVEKSAAASTRLAADVDQTRQRVEALGRKLREEQAQSAAVAAAQDRTSAAFYRQIDSVKQLSGGLQELQRIQAQVRQAKGRGDISQGDYLALVSETARKTRELTDAEALATQKKAQFIRRLKEQTTVQGLTRTELLRVKAAELGVSSAADIYIRKLEHTGTTTHTLGLKSAAARRELGVLAGELARGNFGALRGSGITLANRAGWIEQLMSPKGMMLGGLVGGVAAAVYGLGKAYYEGAKESETFNKQLILTGSYAGKTTGQLNAMAKSLAGNGVTQHDAAGVLAQVVGSGAFTGQAVAMVSRTAARMQENVGQSVDETIRQFKRLRDDPVNAAKELDRTLHFLTSTQLEQIRVLGEQGRVADAAKIAMSAYSNNPAWCLWDMLTHPRYGMGQRIGAADVDRWALYAIGRYCDQMVPDGFGGTEPRMTFNAYLAQQRKAWDVLTDFCSAMRCMPVWNGQRLTFVQDRPSDTVWTYTRSNVVMPDEGTPFRYSFSARKDRHNAVEVNWTDPDNGWQTSTELVEDTVAISHYGRNLVKMDAFGCTSRGQAHRAGLWLIKTELLETQTVDFSVGAEGLRHVPGDVIEVCDEDYAGVSLGGRILSVDRDRRILTLDREITLPSSGTTLISLVDGEGLPVSVDVQSVTDGVQVQVSRIPDGVAEYSVWGLKLPTLRQRLFRCVAVRENDDGTYAITAVQHVPEKESIVDNGASFDPQPGTIHGTVPPAIQHLTTEILAEEGQYQVLARWDTPRVVKGVSFSLRLNVAAEDGSDRLVSSAGTPDTQYRFRGLTPGRYTLTVRAVNSQGQQGDPASTQFSIAAPAAPSFIELTPGYFQITATPRQAVYDPTVQYEFWFSDAQITDIHQVENAARYLGTALYWIAASVNIRPGRDYYFYIRAVNQVGKSAFVEATGQASNDAAGYLDFFKGQITESHLGKELLEKVDLTEDNASKLQQFSKEWQDANDKWNAMWGVKIEQTKDGKYYVAGLGLSMEDTPDGKISQFLVAADRIAYINPANGNETPGFVMQGDQIIMNEAFLKYLSAPTITSGGNPPAFSLTPDGKLTAKNADISGHINAVSGSFTGEINATSGKFSGVIEAREFVGDICGSKVMQGVSIRATNDERSTSTRYTDSATYQIGKTITVMANCERNGGSGAITVTININGQVKTAEVMPYTAGIPVMYQTVVFSVYTTSPVVDISVSLRVGGQYTTSASVWPLVMVSRSGSNFTN